MVINTNCHFNIATFFYKCFFTIYYVTLCHIPWHTDTISILKELIAQAYKCKVQSPLTEIFSGFCRMTWEPFTKDIHLNWLKMSRRIGPKWLKVSMPTSTPTSKSTYAHPYLPPYLYLWLDLYRYLYLYP